MGEPLIRETKNMQMGLERISGTAKAMWTLITIVVSIVTAIASTAIYINDLVRTVKALDKQVTAMSNQLKWSKYTSKPVEHWNSTEDQHCDPGSFMVGAR